ncbi:MAG: hypothetical protein A2452_09995 [Candidatus Firestonebacteria bacterium RIFOXYC2_FULL_39_67]|nr:MAG: hypothetical protein A2497_05345 [Candidatus Firestonebacteria bacterium RifOxyC12_full_39_7]OGF55124.1 MAG: hypothetical protein A2452_09995 [Candidatus Firestonebacteria bacterium RIFOXYC2_FULL_39_67]
MKTKRFISLRVKFTLFLSVFLVAILIVTGQVIISKLRPYLEIELKKKGEALVANLASNAAESVLIGDEMLLASYMDKVKNDSSVVFAGVYNSKGLLLSHTDMKLLKGSPDLSDNLILSLEENAEFKVIKVTSSLIASKKKIGYVVVGFSDEEIQKAVSNIRSIILTITLLVLIAGILFSIFSIGYSLRAVNLLSEGVRKIGSGNLDFKVKVKTGDELEKFADAFNEMTANLLKAEAEKLEKEKLQHELKIAQQIQMSLLPSEVPELKGFEIASYYRSAKDVGGDYYDFIKLSDTKLGVAVADVSGKGVPAALGMATIRSILRANVKSSINLRDVMLNTGIMFKADTSRGMFVTLGFLTLDAFNFKAAFSDAGHLPLIIVKEDGEVEQIKTTGIAMGMVSQGVFEGSLEVKEFSVNKGDLLVLYTDGVNEAMNAKKEEYGFERLIQICKNSRTLSANAALEALKTDILGFTGETQQSDDMTIITIRCV